MSNGQAALVLYSWFDVGGSSSKGGIAQVFTVVGGALRSMQKISWDTHFDAGQPFVTFDLSTDTLVIRPAHYIPGDAHCCIGSHGCRDLPLGWDDVRAVGPSDGALGIR